MLGHILDLSVELQLELRFAAKPPVQNARQLRLLALHAIGVFRDVGDGAEIELRQHTVVLAAVLERRRHQTLRNQRRRGAESIEHIKGRRMKGRGARFLAQVAPGLEHGHGHAAAHQVGRCHQADRPRACNQDPLFDRHDFADQRLLGADIATARSGSYSPASSLRRRSLPTGERGIVCTKR